MVSESVGSQSYWQISSHLTENHTHTPQRLNYKTKPSVGHKRMCKRPCNGGLMSTLRFRCLGTYWTASPDIFGMPCNGWSHHVNHIHQTGPPHQISSYPFNTVSRILYPLCQKLYNIVLNKACELAELWNHSNTGTNILLSLQANMLFLILKFCAKHFEWFYIKALWSAQRIKWRSWLCKTEIHFKEIREIAETDTLIYTLGLAWDS